MNEFDFLDTLDAVLDDAIAALIVVALVLFVLGLVLGWAIWG